MAEYKDYSSFELGDNVGQLAGGVLVQVARADGIDSPLSSEPTVDELDQLVTVLSPDDDPKRDAPAVERLLRHRESAAANWVVRSGILKPLRRSFVTPDDVPPTEVNSIIWGGNVVDWLYHRTSPTAGFQPGSIDEIVLPVSTSRVMSQLAHPLVRQYAQAEKVIPTEIDLVWKFREHFNLRDYTVTVVPVETEDRNQLLDEVISKRPSILDGSVVVVADVPDTVRVAGEVRLAARRADPQFDHPHGIRQLYIVAEGDPRPPARQTGENEPAYVDPFGILGRIARTALVLEQNIAS